MSYHIDLGGAPANERCAQLGHTPDFAAVNAFEVSAYRLAVIALHGLPPEGCRLAAYANHHDFGIYRTLVLHIDDEADAHVAAYAEAVEEGLSSWISACFSPPVEYDGCVATIPRREATELLIGALLVSRPRPDGTFAIPDFERVHTNLTAAFPEAAEAARARLAA
jgi:hypothetical protein